MNKKDLPAMYSTAFWCLIVVYCFFLALLHNHCYWPFIERSEGWSLRSGGVLDQSQQECRFFHRNSNPLQIFQLQPKRETSSSSLGDQLEKRFAHQKEPFVPDFEARLAFVQCPWPLLHLPTNLHYDNSHLHDGCKHSLFHSARA